MFLFKNYITIFLSLNSFAIGCREVFDDFQCICRAGYTGDKCQRSVTDKMKYNAHFRLLLLSFLYFFPLAVLLATLVSH